MLNKQLNYQMNKYNRLFNLNHISNSLNKVKFNKFKFTPLVYGKKMRM